MNFFESVAYGDAAQQATQPSILENMLPLIFIFIAMYFVLLRPQQKKAKEHMELLKNLKAGDEVVTSGGIIARIKSITDDFVTLDLGSAQLKVLKENVIRLGKLKA